MFIMLDFRKKDANHEKRAKNNNSFRSNNKNNKNNNNNGDIKHQNEEDDINCHILGGGDDDDESQDSEHSLVNPEDFLSKHKRDTTIVKGPGSIRGQQYTIDDCKKCRFWLLDNCATIMIDDCSECKFFLGPCESSVFIRNCKDCKIVAATRQFRTRECVNIDVMLFCAAGQPIIESSSGIRFTGFRYSYFSLAAQFKAAGMDVWDTEWSNVFDFTKGVGTHSGLVEIDECVGNGGQNWCFLPPSTTAAELLGKSAHEVCDQITKEEQNLQFCPVPPTWGCRALPDLAYDGGEMLWESCFLLVPGNSEAVLQSVRDWVVAGSDSENNVVIKRSRTRKLGKTDLKTVLTTLRDNDGVEHDAASALSLSNNVDGVFVGIELVGENCIERCWKKFHGQAAGVSNSIAACEKTAVTFFEVLAKM